MNLQNILDSIQNGLTGNRKEDIEYLLEQEQAYKNHEEAYVILSFCSRLMLDIMPEDTTQILPEITAEKVKDILDHVRFNMFKDDFDTALHISEDLVRRVESSDVYQQEDKEGFFDFSEPMEELLYAFDKNRIGEITYASIHYSEIFFVYADLLHRANRIEEARTYFEKAMRWNPANCKIAFEYIDIFQEQGEEKQFYERTLQEFKYAFKTEDLAICYRNLGDYYAENEQYTIAATCYMISLSYNENDRFIAASLNQIENIAPEEFQAATPDLLEQYGLPQGANEDVVGLSMYFGQRAFEKGELETAYYFLSIRYNLTEEEELLELINDIYSQILHRPQA